MSGITPSRSKDTRYGAKRTAPESLKRALQTAVQSLPMDSGPVRPPQHYTNPELVGKWMRWKSWAGEGKWIPVEDADGSPVYVEKVLPRNYGGDDLEFDLGLCKEHFYREGCPWGQEQYPLRPWKPEGKEQQWMDQSWVAKYALKDPVLPPDHPRSKYQGLPRERYNGTFFIPSKFLEADSDI